MATSIWQKRGIDVFKEFLGLTPKEEEPTLKFPVGEGLRPEQKARAEEVIKKPALVPKKQNPFSFAKEFLLEWPARATASILLEEQPREKIQPKTPAERFLFGDDPIYSLSSRKKQAETSLADIGIEKKWTAPLSTMGVFAMTAFDIVPVWPAKRKALRVGGEKVAKELMERQIAKGVTREEAIINARIAKDLFIESKGTAFKLKPRPPVIKGKIVKQEFNVSKLNLTPEQEKGIVDRLGALGLEERRVRTFGEMKRAAENLGTDPRKLLREVSTNRMTDAEAVGLKNLIKDNSDYISKADELKRINPDKIADIEAGVASAEKNIDIALTKLIRGGTEAGRTIASFRIIANKTLEPEFWYLQAKRQLDLRPFTAEYKQAIDDLVAKQDRGGLANFVAGLRKAGWEEKMVTLWKAGLLTSPTTHMANLMGNTTMVVLEGAKDIPATLTDILVSLVTKKRTKVVSLGGFKEQAVGLLGTGTRRAYRFLKTGVDPEEILLKYDIPKKVVFDNAILQGYTNAIFRSLGAEDVIFRERALKGSLFEQAFASTKNEGLKGTSLKRRVQELFLSPTDEMARVAIDDASYATFQKQNILAEAAAGIKAKGKILKTTMEFLAPFTRTPSNIAEVIFDYTPVGFLKELTLQLSRKTLNQKRFAEAFGRSITGTGIITLGYLLSSEGLMAGTRPTSSKEKAQWQLEGKQANSVFFRGKWRRLDRVSPLGNLLLIGVEFQQAAEEGKEGLELFSTTAAEGVKALTEQTFLKGVSGALKAITEPERYAAYFAESTIGSFVPSVVGRIAHIVDPTIRESEGVVERIQSRLPVLSEGLLPRRNSLGEPIQYEGGIAGGMFDPFYSRRMRDDPVVNALRKDDLSIGMPSRYLTIKKERFKLTPEEYDQYLEFSGTEIKERLANWIQRGDYEKLNLDKKETKLDKIIREARTNAKNKIFGKKGQLREVEPITKEAPKLPKAPEIKTSPFTF